MPGDAPRVLMVANRYFPEMGGIETHVYEVARRLAQDGVAITVLATDRSGTLPVREEAAGVQIVRVPAYPATRDYYFAPAIWGEMRRERWDLVHVQGFHALVPPLAMLAARQAGIPYVITSHTGGHSSPLRRAIRGAQWTALRPLLAGAARIITVSHFEQRAFARRLHLPPERFVVIRNGAHLPPVPDAPLPPANGTLLISIGRLERYKGHHRAIEALPTVIRAVPDARLCILGAGPYEEELRRIAHAYGVAERVEIRAVPAVDRAQMAALLSQAALVMLLSEYEAHPVSVMEALALHRPVLVADTSGMTELAEAEWVRAVPLTVGPEGIAAAILRQLRDPFVPEAVAFPTWEQCATQVHEVYTAVLRTTPVCAS